MKLLIVILLGMLIGYCIQSVVFAQVFDEPVTDFSSKFDWSRLYPLKESFSSDVVAPGLRSDVPNFSSDVERSTLELVDEYNLLIQ